MTAATESLRQISMEDKITAEVCNLPSTELLALAGSALGELRSKIGYRYPSPKDRQSEAFQRFRVAFAAGFALHYEREVFRDNLNSRLIQLGGK